MSRELLMAEVKALIIFYDARWWDWINAVEYTLHKARSQ